MSSKRRAANPLVNTYFVLIVSGSLMMQGILAFVLVPRLREFYSDAESLPPVTDRLLTMLDWFAGRGVNGGLEGWKLVVPGVVVAMIAAVVLFRRVSLVIALLTFACFAFVVAEMWSLLAPIYTPGLDAINNVSGG